MDGTNRPDRVAPGTARRTAALFAPYGGHVALIGLAVLVASSLWVVLPFLTQAIFDRALFGPDGVRTTLLWALVLAMVLVPCFASLINYGQGYLTTWLGNRVMRDMRDRLFEHLQSMHFGFFTGTRTGEIQSRLGNDVSGIQSVVTETASTILANAVTVVASLVGMLLLSWQLTIVAVALLPVFVLLQLHVGRVRQRVAASTQSSLAEMTSITQESLSVSGMLLSKVFGRRAYELERYRRENAAQAALQVRQTMTGQRLFAVVFTFVGITPALVYLLTGLGADGGRPQLTAGTLVAFIALQERLLFPIVQLMRVSLDVQTSLALFERIFAYLDLTPEVTDAPGARTLPVDQVRGAVEFRHVWFRYPAPPGAGPAGALPATAVPAGPAGPAVPVEAADDRPGWALRDVTLQVEPGQLAAVVGPSGAGKTTLSYLVPRLYDPDRGMVLIDGQDVRSLSASSLTSVVGMVTQETYLFHGSVRDNLRYADTEATDDQLRAAARAANIDERIRSFPDGYDTVVGERGFRLSGGERQRLAIARVILKNPTVLILDEATSAMDTTGERLVQDALEQLMRGRTTIAIAHRLSTILAADVIFAIDGGRLVEHGTHQELLRRDGLYASLYREQFAPRRSATASVADP